MEEKRIPYATWTVVDEEYRLKLTTSAITKLEEKYKTNLLNLVMNGNMPPLGVILDITHGAMQKFHHGVKLEDVRNLFDDYCDNGGSQMAFMTNVLLPIFNCSGFFSKAQADQMETNLQDAQELL